MKVNTMNKFFELVKNLAYRIVTKLINTPTLLQRPDIQ